MKEGARLAPTGLPSGSSASPLPQGFHVLDRPRREAHSSIARPGPSADSTGMTTSTAMDERVADVVVVGAGPAGSSAAIALARSGISTVLVDKATFPRDKICGDGLTALALRELEALGVSRGALEALVPVRDLWLSSPAHRVKRYRLPAGRGVFAGAMPRRDLDASLVDMARAEAVDVIEGCGVVGAEERPDRVVLRLEDSTLIHARYVVAADGMWSKLRQCLGVSRAGNRGEWHAYRLYLSDVLPTAARDFYIWFERDLLPGYAWSFPAGKGRVNFGFGVRRSDGWSPRDLRSIQAGLLSRPNIAAALGGPVDPGRGWRSWPIPAAVDRAIPTTDRVLFVGDAVAASDVMTGEGIGQAMLTGRWAAEAIVGAGPIQCDEATHSYRERLLTDLVPDHRMASALHRVLGNEVCAEWSMRIAGANDWTRRNFVRWLFEDYPRGIILTPGRVERGMFSRNGAWA